MICRENCGACCIAPSISSIRMPDGSPKPAGIPCPFLDERMKCTVFGTKKRPAVCASLQPCAEMCGDNRKEALAYLAELEKRTAPL